MQKVLVTTPHGSHAKTGQLVNEEAKEKAKGVKWLCFVLWLDGGFGCGFVTVMSV